MNLLSARLAELIAQLGSLRQQLRAAVFESVRATVTRIAGDAVDRLWTPAPRRHPLEARDPWDDDEDDYEERTPRDGTLATVLRAGLGWWFLYRRSIPVICGLGMAGCAVSALVGASRFAPAEVIDLALQALDSLTGR